MRPRASRAQSSNRRSTVDRPGDHLSGADNFTVESSLTGETCQVRGNHSRLAFGRSERGRSRSTRRRSRGHRIRFDRHGGDFTVRDSKKGDDFFFSNGQNIEKDAERRYFRNDSPVKSEGGRRGPRTVANRTRRAASPPRGSPDRGIEVDRQIEAAEETRPSWNPPIREPVDARSSEHRAPSRFANQASRIRGGRPEREALGARHKSTFPNRTRVFS